MSFLFGGNAKRAPNVAETALAASKRTAEARQARIASFVCTLAANVEAKVVAMSATELHDSKITFDLSVLLGTGDGKDTALIAAFGKFPLPSRAEMEYLAKEIKTLLEDPAKHGFTVEICSAAECSSHGVMFTVDWTAPRVPPEPPKAAPATPAAPVTVPVATNSQQ